MEFNKRYKFKFYFGKTCSGISTATSEYLTVRFLRKVYSYLADNFSTVYWPYLCFNRRSSHGYATSKKFSLYNNLSVFVYMIISSFLVVYRDLNTKFTPVLVWWNKFWCKTRFSKWLTKIYFETEWYSIKSYENRELLQKPNHTRQILSYATIPHHYHIKHHSFA